MRTAYNSAARTASPTAEVLSAPAGARGVRLYVDTSAVTDTPSLVVNIERWDNGRNRAVLPVLLAATAITAANAANTPAILTVHPDATAAAGATAADHIGEHIRIRPVHADADSITYSIAYDWLY
jgi:hypothetical protein